MTQENTALLEAILHEMFPYIGQRHVNRPVTVHWFDVIKAINTAIHAKFVSPLEGSGSPLDMLLWCPKCNAQHIDEPSEGWDNPPHRSHLCHDCGCIWRPADVPTNGVKDIKTAGDADTWGWTGGDSLLPSLGKRLAAALAATPTTDSLTADAAAVREAAAKVAEDYATERNEDGVLVHQRLCIVAAEEIAAAIRALPLPAQTVPADVAALVVAIQKEAKRANDVIALNRHRAGQGMITVATAMHRIAEWSAQALAQPKGGE